jgi:hypothetical protein
MQAGRQACRDFHGQLWDHLLLSDITYRIGMQARQNLVCTILHNNFLRAASFNYITLFGPSVLPVNNIFSSV